MKRTTILIGILLFFLASVLTAEEPKRLVERLGYDKDARLLIINADDFGMCHAANMGTFKAFESGGISSATLMVTCPWYLEAANWITEHPQYDVGLHSVLTCEWKFYKWGPVLGWLAPSLCTPEGFMPKGVLDVYAQANLEDVEKETRAQMDRILATGIDVTHIDSHMGTIQLHPDYLAIYAKLAKEYNLPCRMPSREDMEKNYKMGRMLDLFTENGVICPDELLRGSAPNTDETEKFWKERISNLKPGTVTEIYIHCSDGTPEMRAISGAHATRYAETEFFSKPETVQWIKDQGIQTISYRKLRDLQRKENQP